jgi:hypothetical protein
MQLENDRSIIQIKLDMSASKLYHNILPVFDKEGSKKGVLLYQSSDRETH